jgi:hypothetical protein
MTEEIKKAKKSYQSYIGHLGKLTPLIANLPDPAPAFDLAQLEAQVAYVGGKLEHYFEKVMDLASEAEIEDVITQEAEVQTRIIKAKVTLDLKKQPTQPAQTPPATPTGALTAAPPRSSSHTGLPKLELPKFDGSFLEWRPFYDQFVAAVDHRDIPDVHKFTYLKASLTGDASRSLAGLPLTADNYLAAIKLLKSRFGDPSLLVALYADKLVNLPAAPDSDVAGFRRLIDNFNASRRELQQLIHEVEATGEQVLLEDLLLSPILTKKLPTDVQLQWSRATKSAKERFDLESLLEFASAEIEALESLSISKSQRGEPGPGPSSKKHYHQPKRSNNYPPPSATSAFAVGNAMPACAPWGDPRHNSAFRIGSQPPNHPSHYPSTSNNPSNRQSNNPSNRSPNNPPTASSPYPCTTCGDRGHTPFQCQPFLAKSVDDRNALAFSRKLCLNCLGGNHFASNCRSAKTCLKCSGKHHTLLHSDNRSPETTQVNIAGGTGNRKVVLQTALIRVKGTDRPCRALLDTGAELSYMTQELAGRLPRTLAPELPSVTHRYETFGGGITSLEETKVYQLDLSSRHQPHQGVKVKLLALPQLCRPSHGLSTENLAEYQTLPEPADEAQQPLLPIDLLLGMDVIPFLLTEEPPKRHGRLLLTPTIFGTVVSGAVGAAADTSLVAIAKVLRAAPEVSPSWELELIGITDAGHNSTDVPDVKPTLINNRYEVTLPFLDDQRPSFSYQQAQRRNTSHRIEKADTFQSYHDLGILEPCTSTGGSFLPHHGVRSKDKLRIVYDASAKAWGSSRSLNDTLHPGPNLLEDLHAILLRFRTYAYPLVADVEKAFLMVGVIPTHRSYLKVAWTDADGNLRTSQFKRVPFGLNCGPYLLLATIRQHLQGLQEEFPATVDKIRTSLYMDDVVTGANDVASVLRLKQESVEIFSRAGMNLRDFVSLPAVQLHPEPSTAEQKKVLGVPWSPQTDEFRMDLELPPAKTKREVASAVASIFDPLGLTTPWTTNLKIFLQSLWTRASGWDDPLSESTAAEWQSFVTQARSASFSVPRHVPVNQSSTLHLFADASSLAYAAVAYVETNGTFYLLVSRARVAPLRPKCTIPRLELLAALIAVRLAVFIRKHLSWPIPTRYYSDSTIVLSWISKEPTDVFVRNRRREILQTAPPEAWSHIPGESNPADLPSRGVSMGAFRNSVKWRGDIRTESVPLTDDAATAMSISASTETNPVPEADFLARFSDLSRAVRVTAWMLRAGQARARRTRGPLTPEETIRAKEVLLRYTQRREPDYEAISNGRVPPSSSVWPGHPRLDESSGLIFCEPRNQEDPLPWLPIPSALATLVVFDAHHRLYHMGVSSTTSELHRGFWTQRLRRFVKSTLGFCRRCRRLQSRRLQPPEGRLPRARIQEARPFENTGLDHFGPIQLRDGTKSWVLLFTCAVTRAVHLEVVLSLDAAHTALAIRRFFARRGPASLFLSDNGPAFTALAKLLRGVFTWRFIPAAAPWWGGYWERLVGTVKRACKKTLGHASISTEELRTVLAEVEDRVNRRPLVADEEHGSLTPAHFLFGANPPPLESIGRESTSPPASNEKTIQRLAGRRRLLAAHLWSRWRQEYLTSLRGWRRGPATTTAPLVSVGDVVLMAPPDGVKLPRDLWPLGRVAELIHGGDGRVRACFLQIRKHTVRRPLDRLYPLEAADPAPSAPAAPVAPAAPAVPVAPAAPAVPAAPAAPAAPDAPAVVQRTTRSGRPYGAK